MAEKLPSIAVARVAVGIAQGIALFLLYHASDSKSWPATDGHVFAPLLVVSLFVPLLLVTGLGNLRPFALAIWIVVATALCVGLAYYDIYSNPNIVDTYAWSRAAGPRILPQGGLLISLAAGFFIAQSLIVSAAADRRLIASYPRHFDVSWKHGVQIVLAVIFVAVFWALLWLGAALFSLIKLEFLYDLIKKTWFWIPVTAVTVTCALHVTDGSAVLVRGARTLKLTLLSWLLPMMTVIAVAFLLALPFTGLEPLWNTRRATSIILMAAAALVFLINAAYQDGLPEPTVTTVMRYARLIASIVLVPFVMLAVYGLFLRVQQYGWTPQRIFSAACIAVLVCYALGYGIAVAHSGSALRGLQTTNVATAYAILAVLFVLFTPLADPSRISVADQMSRLESGKTSPDKFDFKFLKFDAGIYGTAALEALSKRSDGPQAAMIAEKATQAKALQNRWQSTTSPVVLTPQNRTANISVIYPAGQALPESFAKQDWSGTARYSAPLCLTGNFKCEAILLDLDGDGTLEVVLFGTTTGQAMAFKAAADGAWVSLGYVSNIQCPGVREALRAGKFEAVQPAFKEIEVNGQRLRVTSNCAQATPSPPAPAAPSATPP